MLPVSIFNCKLLFFLYIIKAGFVIAAPGDIARAKCQEYAAAVNTVEDSPVLTRNPGQNQVSQCGILEVPLIIGGVAATPKEFPHMAAIGFGPSPTEIKGWDCGGSLISDSWILTAAHCMQSPNKGPAQKVRLGEVDFTEADETDIQERTIVQKLPHPEYKPPAKYHDIALLKFDQPVTFSGFVRPACLNTDGQLSIPRGIATGFGKMAYDADEGSSKLMKVTITFINSNQCTDSYKREISTSALSQGIHESMLCAGEMNGGKDTCQGDSGGPLQTVLKEPYCMYSLIGVTSFGKFCGFKNSPAIYTKIAYYIPWIESTVW